MALAHSCQSGHHPLADRGPDLYETPACAVEALLRVERLPRRIWEPAAGRGAIVDVLRAHGHTVIGSDIIDYGGLDFVDDFLTQTKLPAGAEAIVTNPPYRNAEAFVRHALELSPMVVMLLRLAFLESERRRAILEDRGLARVHVFRRRLPMMHRDSWRGKRASSAIPFAWYVWSVSRASWPCGIASNFLEHGVKILGIDPGIHGGCAVVIAVPGEAPQLLDAIDIPVTGIGAKERVDVLALRTWIQACAPGQAVIERAQAMPKQGASSGFKYGRATGALEVIACCEIPVTIIEPTAWKKFHGLRDGEKEASRQRALQLFPSAHALLARRKDHGRAEAALLALYGFHNFRGNAAPPGAQPGSISQIIKVEEQANV